MLPPHFLITRHASSSEFRPGCICRVVSSLHCLADMTEICLISFMHASEEEPTYQFYMGTQEILKIKGLVLFAIIIQLTWATL